MSALSSLKFFHRKMAASRFTIIARSFSSSGAKNQMVKTPVPVFGLGGRYAAAIFSAGVKSKDIDKVEADLVKFHEVLVTDKKFNQIVKDPTIKKNQKASILMEAAKKLSLTKTSTNALVLLAENGRLKQFDKILSIFKTVMAAHRGEVPCEVVSAKPLTDAQMKEIEGVLKKFSKGSASVLITTKVDPKIMGGLIVSIGDKYVDMSIATKFKKYTDIVKSML